MKYESVKIDSEVVGKVRKLKEETGVPIGIFFEIAALQKLNPIKPKNVSSKKSSLPIRRKRT